MASFRTVGPFNGVLPAATGFVYGFMRDPKRAPFLQYTQVVPAPLEGNGLFRYCELQPDDPNRIVSLDEYAWGFDDPMPSGKGFVVRAKWDSANTSRFAFPYTLGDRTQSGWQKGAGINLSSMYDKIRLGHAILHRATRVATALRGASWPANNTSTLQALHGSPTPAVYFDTSSGEERLASGAANPNFQLIKRTLNIILRRIDLATNGAMTGEEEFCMVMGPLAAQKIAECGEIVNYLKQNPNAERQLMGRAGKWEIPQFYQGWKFVVEDTPRTFIRMKADGTIADVTVSSEKDYLWSDDSIAFVSRPGGLDGGYGQQNFSTVQLFTYDGPGAAAQGLGDGDLRAGVYVKAEGDSWNELTKGAIVVEDKPLVPVPTSGFYLTGTLTPTV